MSVTKNTKTKTDTDTGMLQQPKSYYDKLPILPTADERDIKKAYFQLARQYHPDKNTLGLPKEKVEEQFLEITHAYKILSDPVKKARYDNLLKYGRFTYDDNFDANRDSHLYGDDERGDRQNYHRFMQRAPPETKETKETKKAHQFTDPFETYQRFYANLETDNGGLRYLVDDSSNRLIGYFAAILVLMGAGISFFVWDNKKKASEAERERIKLEQQMKRQEEREKAQKKKFQK